MKSRTLFCSVLLGVAHADSASAQSLPVITMDKVMTGEQLRTTGVDSLTPMQRRALGRWLSEYTVKMIQFALDSDKPAASSLGSYVGSSGGHWIKSKVGNRSMIILEDGSMWEINSFDRFYTALWLPITNISILNSSQPAGTYKYILLNKDDGEKALAKFVGKE